VRLLSLSYTAIGAISGLLKEQALAEMLNLIKKELLGVARKIDPIIKGLAEAEQ